MKNKNEIKVHALQELQYNPVRYTRAETGFLSVSTDAGIRINVEVLRSYGMVAAMVVHLSSEKYCAEPRRHIFRIDSTQTTNKHIGEFLETYQSRQDTRKNKTSQHASVMRLQGFLNHVNNGMIWLDHWSTSSLLREILIDYMGYLDAERERRDILASCAKPCAKQRVQTL